VVNSKTPASAGFFLLSAPRFGGDFLCLIGDEEKRRAKLTRYVSRAVRKKFPSPAHNTIHHNIFSGHGIGGT
jgi:hypothetical protein